MSTAYQLVSTTSPEAGKIYVTNQDQDIYVELPPVLDAIARPKLLKLKPVVARFSPLSMVTLLMDIHLHIRAKHPGQLDAYLRGELLKIKFDTTDDCPKLLQTDKSLADAVEELSTGLMLRHIGDYLRARKKALKLISYDQQTAEAQVPIQSLCHGIRSLTFVLAISFHSIVEGLALGVQKDTTRVTTLFLSLMVHKLIVAFSVGLQLARTHAHAIRWVVASILLFAVMTPLGAVIGMFVNEAPIDSHTRDFVVLLFQGVAVGTFIYVTFFEVLIHEHDNEHPNLLKILFMLVGFALIGCLRLIDHGHDHGHGDAHHEHHASHHHDH